MAIVIEKRTNLDAPIKVDSLNGVMFTTEAEAHQVIVRCEQEGQELTLAGTVSAKLVRGDGNTVQLIGSISDGAAVVTLTQDCYNVQGRFQLAMFNQVGDAKLCIYACVGYIQKAQSGNLIDGGGIIPDVEDLIADIQAAVESIPPSYTTLLASVAGTYSASKTYAVGEYAWYNGSLYRCSTAISTAEAWTSGHWTAAVLGDDVTSLKSAINAKASDLEIKQIEKLNFDLLEGATWEMGAFNPSSDDVASNNKIRTGYISVDGMNRVILGCDADYRFYGLMYDSSKNVVSGSEFGWTTNSKLIKDLANDFPTAKYLRLCFQKTDETADVTIASHMRGIYYNAFVDYVYRSYLLSDIVYGTTQAVTKDSSGRVTQITHSSGGNVIRTDTITYGNGTITETRTGFDLTVTITTNLTTLAVEVA